MRRPSIRTVLLMLLAASFLSTRGQCDLQAGWALLEENELSALGAMLDRLERTCGSKAGNGPVRAELLALKGCYAHGIGDPRMEEHLLAARTAYIAAGSPWRTGLRLLRVLGKVTYESGDYHRAMDHYREMLSIRVLHDRGNARGLGGDHYNIGNCFWGLDTRDSCKAHYAAALLSWSQLPDGGPPVVAYLHEVLGTYAWEAGDEVLALSHFAQAANRQLKDAPDTDAADELVQRAWNSAGADRDEEAISLFERAVAFRTNTFGNDHPNTACMHSGMAALLLRMDRPGEALSRAQEAIVRLLPGFKPKDDLENPAAIDGATDKRHLYDALVLKFKVLAQRDDAAAAASADEAIDLTVRCIESLRATALATGSKLFWTDQVRGFVEEALHHTADRWAAGPSDERTDRALTLMELGRNALLSEALASLEATSIGALPQPLADKERHLRSRIAEMGRYVLLEEKKCEHMDVDKVGLWRKALTAAEAGLDSLVRAMATSYPGYHALKYGTAQVRSSDLRDLLGDRALLSIHDGEEASYFLLVSRANVQFRSVANVRSARADIQRLRDVLADRARHLYHPQEAYDDLVAAARSLHERILGSFEAPVPEHLIVVADGAYQHIPFEVLLTEAPHPGTRDHATLPYLIKTHVLSYAPGVRPWAAAMVDRSARTDGYLGVHSSQGGGALASARAEVDAAHRIMDGTVLTDAHATESAFKQAATEAGLIHLAMHTVADDLDPMNSALAFVPDEKEDGQLYVHELFGMHLPAQLAILSACGTGEGRMLKGEGRMSLARGFAHAGCPSLVMSLWPCDDAATGAIVAGFLEKTREGRDLDDALRAAKLSYIAGADPLKAHPAYWSSLVLTGDVRALRTEAPWYASPWWSLLLAPLLFWWWRSRKGTQ
ncbi:MAG: CHAT domain-containing protein [Flavobacteriales bacterium]|nr:CHAT domain-containing protein [Flavobacteriales bacterium]